MPACVCQQIKLYFARWSATTVSSQVSKPLRKLLEVLKHSMELCKLSETQVGIFWFKSPRWNCPQLLVVSFAIFRPSGNVNSKEPSKAVQPLGNSKELTKILIPCFNSRKLEYRCYGLTALNLFAVETLPIPFTRKKERKKRCNPNLALTTNNEM